MAKKRFRIKDAQGNVVPYDVAAEDVTLSDGRSVETGKASVLNNAGFLDPAHFPKLMLYNVTPFTSEPDYSAIPVGSIYLDEREDAPYKRLFYKKNIDGNTQTIDLGAPQDGVVYCHQSTGILYRWVPTSYGRDGSFQQVGGDADLRDDSNHVKQSLATPVVLRNVSAATLDDLEVGDVYFDEGHLFCHVSSSNDADLGAPSKKLIYFCLADSKCYRWTGSSFTAITVAPHIDPTTGNWFIGSTNTGISAQGPRGNTVVLDPNEVESFDIINNLTDGGEGDALSAEMGKTLKAAIIQLCMALGDYAFPNGKPVLDFTNGATQTCELSLSLGTGVSSDATDGSELIVGDSLTINLSTSDNLHVIDPDDVEVIMNGVDVTSSVYNRVTDVIQINMVTGNVSVTVGDVITYVNTNNNLAFHLDCKNRGGTSGHWIDLIGNKDFELTSVREADTGMVFNGTSSKAVCSSALEVGYTDGTIEFVVASESSVTNGKIVLYNGYDGGLGAGSWNYNGAVGWATPFTKGSSAANGYFVACAAIAAANSISVVRAFMDGVAKTVSSATDKYWKLTEGVTTGKMYIGSRQGSNGNWSYSAITIMAIRVYNTQLSEADVLHNYKVDKKRFNLS